MKATTTILPVVCSGACALVDCTNFTVRMFVQDSNLPRGLPNT